MRVSCVLAFHEVACANTDDEDYVLWHTSKQPCEMVIVVNRVCWLQKKKKKKKKKKHTEKTVP
eukprot:NODE_13899_length_1140_cov_4.065153.p7 GENE.NODE_13899_length_1140_cov_4.065153~~NODE_13899_length_1140_cov_4.065153.p7  ORF type:complete len:63 (-),score=24.86 NODE_13899_length_1140_cov_4.065153:52-240(-)